MNNGIQKFTAEVFSIQDLKEWGKFAQESGVLPSGCTPMQAMAIIQTGRELGVAPMAALRTMAFVQGRLCLSTQLMVALARREQGITIAGIEEENDEKGNPSKCAVTLARGKETITLDWTMEDAKKANLSTKNNWTNYPAQMLRWRAICDALRIIAPDLVMGLASKEEAEDMEPVAPLAFDPAKKVEAIQPGEHPDEPIGKKKRTELTMAMKKNGWLDEKGKATPDALERLTTLGYSGMGDVPNKEYDNVLAAFSIEASKVKQEQLAV